MHSTLEALLTPNSSHSLRRNYRSLDGQHDFTFRFVPCSSHIEVYCLAHPSLNGQDDAVSKTHLYSSGRLCFVQGKEPRTHWRAEELAAQWAEYFLEYRRTGITQE